MSQEPDPQLEDRLASLEPPYRSKGEVQVGRMLDRYGIPFYYEHPTLVYDRGRHKVWHPDFLLPEQNGLIVEYAGMMDVPDYAAGIRHKREAYRVNGMAAMFLYPADLMGPDWQDQVYRKLLESQNAQPWREAYQHSAPLVSSQNTSSHVRSSTDELFSAPTA